MRVLRFSPLSLEFWRKDTDKAQGKKHSFSYQSRGNKVHCLLKEDAFRTLQKEELPCE